MSTYTLTRDDLVRALVYYGAITDTRVDAEASIDRFIVSVQPNLDDPGTLALIRRAIADPNQFVPRGDNYTEPITSWSARAVQKALAKVVKA